MFTVLAAVHDSALPDLPPIDPWSNDADAGEDAPVLGVCPGLTYINLVAYTEDAFFVNFTEGRKVGEGRNNTQTALQRFLVHVRAHIEKQCGETSNRAGKPARTKSGKESKAKKVGSSKYTAEKVTNMQTSFDKHLAEGYGVKYAWDCVAEEHGIPSGKAAEMAVRRWLKENK